MPTPNKAQPLKTKYRWIRSALNVLLILLLTIVLIIPGVLRLIYRADSQVALGNAKSVRVAFQVIGTEAYGSNGPFGDASHKGGVADGLYDEIIKLSKAPGDFWVLQTDETGYQVLRFLYQEGGERLLSFFYSPYQLHFIFHFRKSVSLIQRSSHIRCL